MFLLPTGALLHENSKMTGHFQKRRRGLFVSLLVEMKEVWPVCLSVCLSEAGVHGSVPVMEV